LRDEGTSYHYSAPADFAEADSDLVKLAAAAVEHTGLRSLIGATWTTDAPYRETAESRQRQILAVEMEAAALYTFAVVRQVPLLCLNAAL
jgi:purine-nucleoside phosphorylase